MDGEPNQSMWLPAIEAAEMNDGDVVPFDPPSGERIAIYRVGDDFFATQDRCTHAKASLCEGWLEGYSIGCPVHTAEFDVRTGAVLRPPADQPLKTYPARVSDGVVQVDVGAAGDASSEIEL